MNLEELLAREGIRHTMARYNTAGDRLRVAAFTAVFTEDGVLESEGVGEADQFRYEGREAISAWLTRWTDAPPDTDAPSRRATFIRHHLSTCDIEFTGPDTATARTYWTAYTDIGPDHCGCYVDAFRRVGGDWLIAHRRVRLDWRSADSLFTTTVRRTR